MAFFEKIKNAWDALRSDEPRAPTRTSYGYYSSRPMRSYRSYNSMRIMVGSIYNRIAVHCSLINLNHVRLDQNGRYLETIKSKLNRALTTEANVDQTGRELVREAISVMLNNGYVALVPTYTTKSPKKTDAYDIYEIRVAEIKEWLPQEVRVSLYDEMTGQKVEKVLSKSFVAIVENPFYETMNEPNSVGKRLMRVLNQLDRSNDNSCSDKLDLIIQLPYAIKSEARKEQAKERRKDIEAQLTGSQYGIAYVDSTEKIVQLNRSLENNLWNQAKDLMDQFYNELGLSRSIFDGSANEQQLLNFNNTTIEPILTALVEEMERKWISRTAQTQGQAIRFFDDPFRLVPMAQLAEMVDKLTRNEIMTSNEIRGILRMKPIDDPKADELRNSNLNHPDESGSVDTKIVEDETSINEEIQNQIEKE